MPDETANRNVIELCTNGPLLVHGRATLNGEALDDGAALCRCGQSNNKPYCDGSHNECAFADEGAVAQRPMPKAADGSTPWLDIKTARNGPLMCAGAFVLRASDGAEITGSRAALCRCGASNTKPFCDGTHGSAGFEAE